MSMLTYPELHEKYCRLKINDSVILICKEDSYYNGWKGSWCDEIELESHGIVKDISSIYGVCIYFPDFRLEYKYPYYCLDLIEDPKDYGIKIGSRVKYQYKDDIKIGEINEIEGGNCRMSGLPFLTAVSQFKLLTPDNKLEIIAKDSDGNDTTVPYNIEINYDGSIKIDCSTISNDDVDKIVKLRQDMLKLES